MDDIELLNYLYYEKHNYDSIDNLYKKAKEAHPKITKTFVKNWLSKQQTQQVNIKPIKQKEFLPIYSEAPYAFQIDLTFLPRYKKQNDGYYVLFTAININTRYAYAYYAKDKEMNTVLDMLKKMEKKTIINSISCDEGSEFKNREFQKYCKDNDISLFFILEDSHKLGIINRFHRTLKDRLKKYFHATDSLRWIDSIDEVIYNYNHTVNTGIGYKPADVTRLIENMLVSKDRAVTGYVKSTQYDFKVGDNVRILNKRTTFTDKMDSLYSSQVYTVTKTTANSCYLTDGIKRKNDELKLVNEVEKPVKIKQLQQATKENTIRRRIAKSGVQEENIITEPRIRKRKVVVNV